MQIYIAIYIFNTILSYLNSKNDTKKLLILSFSVLNIFLCFNYLNGIDWTHYQITFINTPNLLEIADINSLKGINVKGSEFLFIYLIAVFKLIPNLNYEIFQYMLLTIDLLIIYWFLNKYSKNPLLIILLLTQFLAYMMFEPILRQLQSLVIFLYAIEEIKRRNLLRYLILITLATLFHSSAIILFPIYFIYTLKFNLKRLNIIFIITLLMIILFDYLVEIFIKISFLSHYASYLKSSKTGVQSFSMILFMKILLRDILPINLINYFKNKNKIKIRNYRIVLICNVIYIVIRLLSLKVGIIFRFNNYFFIFSCIYLSYLFLVIKRRDTKLILKILVVSYFFLTYMKDIEDKKVEKYKMIPYSNYLIEYNQFKNSYQKIKFRLKYFKL